MHNLLSLNGQTPRIRVTVIFLFFCFLLPQGFAKGLEKESGTLRNFKKGDQLPPLLLLSDMKGGPLQTFTPGNGRPSVIMFFSIRPNFRKKRALAMLSSLTTLADQYKGKIDVLGVYSDSKQQDVVTSYMKNSSVNIPVLVDGTKKAYNQYGVFMMPLVIITDSTGKLHEVVPYTFNIREIIEGNVKLLLGEWDKSTFLLSLQPKEKAQKTEKEKEYIRRINYGKIMRSKKMNAQAIREFSIATKLMPKQTEAYIELGYALLADTKYSEAMVPFEETLKIDPESDEALAGIGLSYYGNGMVDKALPVLENAFISADPRLEVIISLANVYEKKGDNVKANRLNKLAISKLMTLYEQRWK